MLIINYDPEFGYTVPDDRILQEVEDTIRGYENLKGEYNRIVTYGNELVLSAFRLAVKKKRINPEELSFVIQGTTYYCDDDGRYRGYIPGLCMIDHILSGLCGWDNQIN